MFLILGQKECTFCQALKRVCKRRGIEPLLLDPLDIARNLQLSFFVDGESVSLSLFFKGKEVQHRDIEAVYCSVDSFEPELWSHFEEKDDRFAASETHALWLAILSGLECTVINPPSPESLAGAALSTPEVFRIASEAGLGIPAVADVDSGDLAAQVILRNRHIQYFDLGDPKEGPPVVGGLAGLENSQDHFRLVEKVCGSPVFVTAIGTSFRAHEGGSNARWPENRLAIPGSVRGGLMELQRGLNLCFAEYFFGVSREGEWIFQGYERGAPKGYSVMGDRLLDDLLDFATGKVDAPC